MNYKYQYQNSTDRQTILDNNKDKILIEDQDIIEGKFLIFSDVKPLEEQVKDLQKSNVTLMDAIANIYEGLANKGSI